jgi:predicted permease
MRWWRRLIARDRLERDLDRELQDHLERQVMDSMRSGMSEADARRKAALAFGGIEGVKEDCRDARGTRWIEQLAQDMRYAFRSMGAHPAVSATVIASLALGIGANVTIFSVVNAVLLQQLDLPAADRLAVIWKGPIGEEPDSGISPANALEIADWSKRYADAAPFTLTSFLITADGEADRVTAMRVASGFFATLGVPPAIGRDFAPADDRAGGDRVAILSHSLWVRRFGADPGILGRAIPTGSGPCTIVGVMPADFRFPELLGTTFRPELWTPLAFSADEAAARGAGYMFLLLKRRAQWTWEGVQREIDGVARTYARLEPSAYGNQQLTVIPALDKVVGSARALLVLLWTAVACVLVIACANAANVILSRTLARSRELAVRASLGASRRRLVAQLVTEGLLLSSCAAAAGLLIAALVLRVAHAPLADILPRADEITIDWRVLAATLVAALLTTIAVGVLPALHVSAGAPRDVLSRAGTRGTTEGRRSAALRRILLGAQIALAVALAVSATLLGRSFAAAQSADLGFRPQQLVTFEVALPEQLPKPAVRNFYARLSERLRAIPSVTAVGTVNLLPLSGTGFGWAFLTRDRPAPPGEALPHAEIRIVTPGTLETLGVPLRHGRSIAWSDTADGQPVAMVSESFARRVWGTEDPIGKQVRLAGPIEGLPWMTVVGVVGDVRFGAPDRAPDPALYRPHAQHSWSGMSVVVRSAAPLGQVGPAARAAIRRLDASAAILAIRPFTFYLSRSVAQRAFVTALVSTFAGIALVLAVVGVYGLFAYAAAARTREIGVRIALGAGSADVVWLMLRQALLVGIPGMAAGIAGVLAAQRLIEHQLFGVEATDPAALIVIPLFVLVIALLASYLPARRAAAIDPTTALRAE